MSGFDVMPDEYRDIRDEELKCRIMDVKRKLGSDLCILGHYYQRDEVIEFADREGDSFQLAKAGAETSARSVVFCGVHFMAEASVILAKGGQRVFLPNMDAGCPLADFATAEQVERAWGALSDAGLADKFIPITYMNSSAEIKAFCGRNGGAVCTSSSAARAFDWAFGQGRKILFLPDENLGRNVAIGKGVGRDETCLWDPSSASGGPSGADLDRARMIVWKGYCHVHTLFALRHVEEARQKYPGCRIVVHPECTPDVVAASDGNGSTAFLKKYVEDAPKGQTIVVGTEINMVSRLARRHPDKRVIPLARSLCPNMFRISLANLCWTLEELGNVNEVFVEDSVAKNAHIALDRMLTMG